MRRARVVAALAASVLGIGVWSAAAVAATADVSPAVDGTPVTVVVDDDAPVCTAEQTEAAAPGAAAAQPTDDATTLVSFTLVDARCAE